MARLTAGPIRPEWLSTCSMTSASFSKNSSVRSLMLFLRICILEVVIYVYAVKYLI